MESIFKRKQLLTLFIRGTLLLFCLLFVFAACSKGKKQAAVPGDEWAEDFRDRIEKHIQDQDKKRQLMDLVDQDVKIFNELSDAAEKNAKELLAVDSNYNATPEDFKKVFTKFNVTRYRLRSQSMEIRFKMNALCTSEEWKGLSHIKTSKGLFNLLPQSIGSQ